MPSADLLELLSISLPEEGIPVVLSALKRDPLVWEAVQDNLFLQRMNSDQLITEDWQPANLVLKILNSRMELNALKGDHFPSVEPSIRKKALETFESLLRTYSKPQDLKEAGLIALALRERLRKTQTWLGLLDELRSLNLKNKNTLIEVWKTPLLCLFGMVPDREELLKSMLCKDNFSLSKVWITHILLGNPLDEQELRRLFMGVFAEISLSQQVEWLVYLKKFDESQLAGWLADQVLRESHLKTGGLAVVDLEALRQKTWVELANEALELQWTATLHQIAGHPAQAELFLSRSKNLLQHWLGGTTLQLISVAKNDSKTTETLWDEVEPLLSTAPLPETLMEEAVWIKPPVSLMRRLSDFNLPLLVQVFLKGKSIPVGETQQEREAVRETVQEWLKRLQTDEQLPAGQFVFDYSPFELLEILEKLSLYQEALKVALLFLNQRVSDVSLLTWTAQLAHRLGQDETAIRLIREAMMLEKTNPDHYRTYAKILEDRNEWEAALKIRQEILHRFGDSSLEDHLNLITCAIGGKDFELAANTCQQLIEKNGEEGRIFTLLGLAQFGQGKFEEAHISLSKATLLAPEEPKAWLELARLYHHNGEFQRELETLRAALLNVPDSAELHLALGRAYLANGLSAEALPYLKQSARLAPESDEVALVLIQTLASLGHDKEALEVAERARLKWPAHPDLTYEHARILLRNGEIGEGSAILEVALQFEGAKLEWFIEYAKVLLNGAELRRLINPHNSSIGVLVKAQKALQRALKEVPDHFEALLLKSEIHLNLQEWDQALAGFQHLLETEQAGFPEWSWRIQSGLGLIAFHKGENEMALAALQNAVQSRPDNVEIKQLLAEVYFRLNLHESAFETAQQVRKLQPNAVECLVWFSDLMERLNEFQQSIEALQTLVEFYPQEVGYGLKLAGLWMKNGDHDSANEELKRVLALDHILPEQLETVAEIALSMGNLTLAKQAIEKAITLSEEPSYLQHFHLALLHWRNSEIEAAHQALQTALTINPSAAEAYIFQSELQKSMQRPQAAIASLEKALRICESQVGGDLANANLKDSQLWGYEPASAFAVHRLFVPLCLEAGELNLALYHAESALQLCPTSLEMAFYVADLAHRLLQPERFVRIAGVVDQNHSAGCFTSFTSEEESEWLAGLHAFQAEQYLEAGELVEAEKAILKGLVHKPEYLHLKALRSRLNARLGKFTDALSDFRQAWLEFQSDERKPVKKEEPQAVLLTLAEAAFDLMEWQAGIQLAESYLQKHENEPAAYLIYAKGLIRALEWQRLLQTLGVVKHALKPNNFGNLHQQARELLEKAGQLTRSRVLDHWSARAEALLHTDHQRIQELSAFAVTDEDFAWLVEAHLRGGNPAGAMQMAEIWRQHPFVQMLGALLWEEEDSQRALDYARSAVEKAAFHPIYQAVLARIAEKNQDYAQALEAIEVALGIWDDEINWQLWAADLAERCSETETCRIHLEKAHQLNPKDYELLVRLIQHYLKSGYAQQAVDLLQETINDYAERSEMWLLLALALQGCKDDRAALRAAEKAAELDETNGKAWITAGEIALRLGEDNKVLFFVRQAEKVAPADAGTRLLAVKILTRQGQSREALAELNRAIEEIPGNWELEYERARLIAELQGVAAAQDLLQKLVSAYPQNEKILWFFAQTCMKTGKIKLAEQSALQALKLNPQNVEIHRLLAEVFKDQGQLDRAVFHLSEAIRLQPSHLETYLKLAEVYSSRREFNKALTIYQQAIQINPQDYRPYYYSALVLRDGKDYPAAEVMLRRAAELAPEDVNIRRQLGAIIALNLVHHGQEAKTCL